MRLEGSVIRGNQILRSALLPISEERPDEAFSKRLDRTLQSLCKVLLVPLPIWLKKNTREFAHFHLTQFFGEQFADKVKFDFLQIRLLDDES